MRWVPAADALQGAGTTNHCMHGVAAIILEPVRRPDADHAAAVDGPPGTRLKAKMGELMFALAV
jgi:hypothetical protein